MKQAVHGAARQKNKARPEPPPRPPWIGQLARWDFDSRRWRHKDFWFDEIAAQDAVDFFAELLTFTTGVWRFEPFILEPWQENEIIRPLFGWKLSDGTRRYRRCFIWVPRKNGKTELAAGVALYMLVADKEQGAEVYAIATNQDQAEIVFKKAAIMVNSSASLKACLQCYKTSIYCADTLGTFQPLSGTGKGKHGLSASGLIADELHEWVDGDLYQFIHDSSDSRLQPLEFMISTSGTVGTHGHEIFKECEKIADGTIEDDETLVVIYVAGPDEIWHDEKTWFRCNPNLNVSKSLDAMRANAKRARQLPRHENAFRQFQLNQWTEAAVRWLPIDSVDDDGRKYGWNYCAGKHNWRELDDMLRGKMCFSGLDLSSTQDLTALVHYFPTQKDLEIAHVIARFFKPAALIMQHTKRDKLPYDRWLDERALYSTPGNAVDYAFLKKVVFEDAERFEIKMIGADKFNATQTVIEINQEGIETKWVQQGFLSLSPPAKELERHILEGDIAHGDHPVLTRHAKAVAIVSDPAENIKPTKEKSTERIDGIVALLNAIHVASVFEGDSDLLTSDDFIKRGGLL